MSETRSAVDRNRETTVSELRRLHDRSIDQIERRREASLRLFEYLLGIFAVVISLAGFAVNTRAVDRAAVQILFESVYLQSAFFVLFLTVVLSLALYESISMARPYAPFADRLLRVAMNDFDDDQATKWLAKELATTYDHNRSVLVRNRHAFSVTLRASTVFVSLAALGFLEVLAVVGVLPGIWALPPGVMLPLVLLAFGRIVARPVVNLVTTSDRYWSRRTKTELEDATRRGRNPKLDLALGEDGWEIESREVRADGEGTLQLVAGGYYEASLSASRDGTHSLVFLDEHGDVVEHFGDFERHQPIESDFRASKQISSYRCYYHSEECGDVEIVGES
jgi:hypothetical protein